MAHGSSNPAAGTDKRRSGKQGAYDPRFVQRGEKINPQSKENFSSSFLIRGVVILNVASGFTCESVLSLFSLCFSNWMGIVLRLLTWRSSLRIVSRERTVSGSPFFFSRYIDTAVGVTCLHESFPQVRFFEKIAPSDLGCPWTQLSLPAKCGEKWCGAPDPPLQMFFSDGNALGCVGVLLCDYERPVCGVSVAPQRFLFSCISVSLSFLKRKS